LSSLLAKKRLKNTVGYIGMTTWSSCIAATSCFEKQLNWEARTTKADFVPNELYGNPENFKKQSHRFNLLPPSIYFPLN